MERRRSLGAVAVAFVLALFGQSCRAETAEPTASGTGEEQLAAKYALILSIATQAKPCADKGDVYFPVPVEILLGNTRINLVEDGEGIIRTGPTAGAAVRIWFFLALLIVSVVGIPVAAVVAVRRAFVGQAIILGEAKTPGDANAVSAAAVRGRWYLRCSACC